MESRPVIKLEGVCKTYNEGEPNEVKVLKKINLLVRKGEMIAVMGPSGSGKTTLLDVMGCLLKPNRGKVYIDGTYTGKMADSELARIRKEKVGFIFQTFNLIPNLTALENVELALRIAGKPKEEAERRAKELLKLMGLGHRIKHRPPQLSGGEQQRVAISRALANEPKIILGDEPTGNLDTKTGESIVKLLKDLNKSEGYTIVLVTHDPGIARYTNRTVKLRDGEIVSDELKADKI
jgi:putative ABC transport system ATP-binding protein